MEAFAWFVASLRLTMRGRYQASNHDVAEVLTEFACEQGFHPNPQFTGCILKNWGDPKRVAGIHDYQLRTMYQFYLHRQLVPSNDNGWFGLIAVHHYLNGDWGSTLPRYLQDQGASVWEERYQQQSKETA